MIAEIYYFSGTGNSLTVAKDITEKTEGILIPVASLLDKKRLQQMQMLLELSSQYTTETSQLSLKNLYVNWRTYKKNIYLQFAPMVGLQWHH